MQINSDISRRVVIEPSTLPWVAATLTGVQMRTLEGGPEPATRATAIVKLAPGAIIENCTRDLGEEIVVLDGVLTDQFGSYGKGCYVKIPPGSAHACESAAGCMLFVKRHHLEAHDHRRIVVDSTVMPWYQGLVDGLSVMPLAEFGTRHTALVRWSPGTRFNPHRHYGGEEIYVLEGVFEDEYGRYPAGTWIRSPHMSAHCPYSIEGCTILVKTGHLLQQETGA
ncbi:MAG TPA: cupin domain-containing protein [Gallionella sp.]|nr:cupin domain-containing protein [Gallionella sp.]